MLDARSESIAQSWILLKCKELVVNNDALMFPAGDGAMLWITEERRDKRGSEFRLAGCGFVGLWCAASPC